MDAVATPPPAADSGQLTLSPPEFDRIRALIYKHAGINLQANKQAMVYSRLSRRLRDTGQPSFAAYLALLDRGDDPAEWQEFVNCLTTNLTAFFREDHHFGVLADDLRRRAAGGVALWCSAASTGEEPYSLAMTVLEALGPAARVRLLASDIDTKVLATARRGVYAADARGLSPQRLKRHFLRGTGANTGAIRVRPELARLLDFMPFNLMSADWSALGEPFDIIFCRNVMIYFDHATQRCVLQHMHARLKPGGLLYVGHSENFADARDIFRLRGKTVYERV